MSYIYFSAHAEDRLARVARLVRKIEIVAGLKEALRQVKQFPVGETAILVKRLPTAVCSKKSEGDLVYVIYKRGSAHDDGHVATIELRRASQGPSARWCKVIDVSR